MVVKAELKKLGLHYTAINLGEVEIMETLTKAQREKLSNSLIKSGLVLLDDKKVMLIEKIKGVIVEMVHYADELPKTNFSEYLSKQLNYDYTYMANLFSEIEGATIEHYILIHKIEKVKELIIYDELNLTEIAHKLHYSSVAHLSRQFKNITGLTPTFFKSLKDNKRNALENL
jgi:AraC-like DNA-binding protein